MESKPRLLVVGSAPERRTALALTMMESDIFEVVEASSPSEAMAVSKKGFAGVVCALPLRGHRGELELLRFLRRSDQSMLIAVVGITAEAWGVREVLQAGADLYFRGSFDLDLVAAHMEVGIRRRAAPTATFRAGDLRVDISGHRVWRGDIELHVTPIEFRLLVTLVKHVDEVVSKGALFEESWRRRDDPRGEGDHLVEVHVSQLRKKLHAGGVPILHTIHGVGYALRPSSPG